MLSLGIMLMLWSFIDSWGKSDSNMLQQIKINNRVVVMKLEVVPIDRRSG